MMENKVLYCGMADDILTPLILVPDLSKLFVIDYFDAAFAKNGTWKGQKEDIKECLVSGSNEKSHHREVYLHYDKNTKIYSIDEPCTIINESDMNNCWTLTFKYKRKIRKLIYFHHTDFISYWDDDINEINHIMCIGAEFPILEELLNTMLHERTTKDCKFYDQFAEYHNTAKKVIIGEDIFINDLSNLLSKGKHAYNNIS